jgi:hypothetical protein
LIGTWPKMRKGEGGEHRRGRKGMGENEQPLPEPEQVFAACGHRHSTGANGAISTAPTSEHAEGDISTKKRTYTISPAPCIVLFCISLPKRNAKTIDGDGGSS